MPPFYGEVRLYVILHHQKDTHRALPEKRVGDKCREMNEERICLLDICPPHVGEIQRRVIQVNRIDQEVWREFDVVRMFESEEEAREYADRHGIDDMEL